jgi:hypothetical protein
MKRTPVLSLLAAATLSGCYNYTRIDPRDTPGLNGAATVQLGTQTESDCRLVTGAGGQSHRQCSPRTTAVYGSTVSVVRTDDGRTAQFVGPADLRITPNAGPSVLFSHPTLARLEGDTLYVAGSDRPEAAFRVEETSVEVRQVQPGAWALGGVAASALAVLVVFAAL